MAWRCVALSCTAGQYVQCSAVHFSALHCIVLQQVHKPYVLRDVIGQYSLDLYQTVFCSIVLCHVPAFLDCTGLDCTVLHFTVLCCIAAKAHKTYDRRDAKE